MRRSIIGALALILSISAQASEISKLDLVPISGEVPQFMPTKEKQLFVFWATWCSDCKAKLQTVLPEWQKRSDLQVSTINLDRSEQRVVRYLKSESISLPVYRHPSKTLQKEFGIYSVPHWLMYQREGTGWKLLGQGSGFDETQVKKLVGI